MWGGALWGGALGWGGAPLAASMDAMKDATSPRVAFAAGTGAKEGALVPRRPIRPRRRSPRGPQR
jgi:hypothetical protein